MRTPQRARIERLEKWAAPAEVPLEFVVVFGEATPAQEEQIAQAQAAGRPLGMIIVHTVATARGTGGRDRENP